MSSTKVTELVKLHYKVIQVVSLSLRAVPKADIMLTTDSTKRSLSVLKTPTVYRLSAIHHSTYKSDLHGSGQTHPFQYNHQIHTNSPLPPPRHTSPNPNTKYTATRPIKTSNIFYFRLLSNNHTLQTAKAENRSS